MSNVYGTLFDSPTYVMDLQTVATAEVAQELPEAPYPPEQWLTRTGDRTIQELLLDKLGPEQYGAYVTEKTAELERYRPDWRLWAGMAAAVVALIVARRRR